MGACQVTAESGQLEGISGQACGWRIGAVLVD